MSFHVPEKYRVRGGHPMASDESYGNNGLFVINKHGSGTMTCIASDGGGWEHVSVSFRHRTPKWEEMCWVKNLFWDENDCVIQFHPAKKDYVNKHPHCLHLWRPIGQKIPTPPKEFVG